MSNGIKKTILLVLIVTIIIPASFLIQPKKANAAATSCLIGQFGSLIGGLGSVVGSIMAVPVDSKTLNQTTSTTAGASVGTNIGECLLKTLARVAAQTLIHSFTQSTLRWINSGFHDSPTFITNPNEFFGTVVDRVGGQFIQSIAPELCSPFRVNIQRALNLNLGIGTSRGGARYQYVGCTLTGIQNNIYNGFVGGNWGGTQGWSNWINVTQPQNNFYGVYLYGSSQMGQNIASKSNTELLKLNWGKGFLSSEKCYNMNGDEATDAEYNDPLVNLDCEITTPGSTIQDGLSKTLGIPADTLSVSQDIDDILNALVNQGITQIFSGMGLLGMSRPNNQYGGRTYTGNTYSGGDYLSTIGTTFQGQVAAGQTRPPAGIDCSKTYKVNSNTANGVTTLSVSVLTDGHWGNGTVFSRTCEAGPTSTGAVECHLYVPTTIVVPQGQTATQLQNQIDLGCRNLAAAAPVNDVLGGIAGQGSGIEPGGTPGATPDHNVLNGLGVTASQSAAAEPGVTTANKAIDGTKNLCISRGNCSWNDVVKDWEAVAVPAESNRPIWWQVGFPLSTISNIKIYPIQDATYIPHGNGLFASNIGTVNVELFKTGQLVWNGNNLSLAVNNLFDPDVRSNGYSYYLISDTANNKAVATLSQNIIADQLKITFVSPPPKSTGLATFCNSFFPCLGLDEVEVMGTTDSAANSGGGTPSVPHSVARNSSPVIDVIGLKYSPGNSLDTNGNPTITSTDNLPAMRMKISLKKIDGTSVNLSTIFKTFDVARSQTITGDYSSIWSQMIPEQLFPINANTNILNNACPATDTYCDDNLLTNSGLSLNRVLSQKTTWIKIIGKMRDVGLPSGDYKMTIDITEDTAQALQVGTQTYTFTTIGNI